MKEIIDLSHRITTSPFFYLVLSFFLTIFCTGFQNVSLFAWFQPFFLLIFIYETNHIGWLFLSILTQTIGTTFAYSGILNDPDYSVENVAVVFGVGFIYNLLFNFLYFIYVRFMLRFPLLGDCVCLVLPTLYTALQFLIQFSPFGDIYSLAYSQIDWGNFMKFTSIFGLAGLTFVIVLFSTLLHYHYLQCRSRKTNPDKRTENESYHMTTIFIILFVLVMIYGGYYRSTYGEVFYQKSLPDIMPDRIPAACLVDQYPTANTSDVLNRTLNLARNHRLVLWSETAVVVSSDEEDEFLSNVSAIASTNNAFIGAAYLLKLPGDSMNERNMLVLISDSGEILFRYQKTHPVPFVEGNVQPGPGMLHMVTTSIGKLSGAICFDLNSPYTIIPAGRADVDLLLQPSWTWGPIGKWHEQLNAIRAVELGLYIFRCGSVGYSGVYTPNGETLYSQPALKKADFEQILIPIEKRGWTWYGLFGDVMPWICVVIMFLVYLPLALLPLTIIEKLLGHCPNVELLQKLNPQEHE